MTTPLLAADTLRIAFAIVLDAAALIVWDIGTRSPMRLVADMRAALSRPSAVIRGSLRFVLGAVALIGAAGVSTQVAVRPLDATIVTCGALVTALVLEGLIGPDLRARR